MKNLRLTALTLIAIFTSSLTVITGQSAAIASPPLAGTLDTSFNSAGPLQGVETSTFGNDSGISSIAIDSSGKILAGGYSYDGSHYNFTLARYNTDGSLDSHFGAGGVETSTIGSGSVITSIAIDRLGRILAGGYSGDGSHNNFTLARYNTDGSLDSHFGAGGVETTTIGSGGQIKSIAIDRSGKILAGGFSNDGSHNNFTLARYTETGTLDTTFNSAGPLRGVETTTIGSGSDITSIAIDSSGKILAGGYSYNRSPSNFTLARYTETGTLDTTFNSAGPVQGVETTTIGSNPSYINSIAIDSSGKILAGGASYDDLDNSFIALTRYDSNGSLDSGFGAGGVETTTIGSDSRINSIAIDRSGKILAGGYSYEGSDSKFTLARYSSSGHLDNSFGAAGVEASTIGSNYSYISSIAIDSSGKILAGGYSYDGSYDNFTLARYNGDPVNNGGDGGDGGAAARAKAQADADAAAAAAKAQQDHDTALALGTLTLAIGSVESGLSTLTLAATRGTHPQATSVNGKSKKVKKIKKKAQTKK